MAAALREAELRGGPLDELPGVARAGALDGGLIDRDFPGPRLDAQPLPVDRRPAGHEEQHGADEHAHEPSRAGSPFNLMREVKPVKPAARPACQRGPSSW